ncbi:aldo/keto reductase [Govanella unica]|uniref:Aldo/keto reductase n=1 Tax=Govanella unica TaxID=2975056 RepID=A0A9X3TY89_9PROT|nr:aldo/keto reductase [Govania unica]MDA5193900.1 aldo/keto reductase [Govania unica]
MTKQPTIRLNDGYDMPQLGFGVWQIPDDQTVAAVGTALAAGYRSVDTAAIYKNEGGVGRALREAQLPRAELFITTKLWNEDQGYDSALRAFDESMTLLGLDYLDLYLIHWPVPGRGFYLDSWRAMIRLRDEGRVRSIGVSNFMIPHLEHVMAETGVVPAVNQIELHPMFQQSELRAFHQAKGIATESWSPLGRGAALDDPGLQAIASKYDKSPAQVVLRWHMELGLITIPKSVTPARIKENLAVFDFALDAGDLAVLTQLDRVDGRTGPDPLTFS